MERYRNTVLVVEDSDDDFEFTEKALREGGLNLPLVRCSSGEEALDFIYKRGKYDSDPRQNPVLVLLDLNMYGIDGREVLRQLKLDESVRDIPVIVLTTSPHERDIEACYKLGANSFVQKPVDYGEFADAIKSIKDFWLNIAILPGKNR